MCLALRLRIRDGAIAAWAREAQGVDVLRAIASATRVTAGKHVGVATLQGEGDSGLRSVLLTVLRGRGGENRQNCGCHREGC